MWLICTHAFMQVLADIAKSKEQVRKHMTHVLHPILHCARYVHG